jgi:chitodextrinase
MTLAVRPRRALHNYANGRSTESDLPDRRIAIRRRATPRLLPVRCPRRDLDASGSSDPDNDPLTFNWNFGDGGSGAGAVAQHRYTSTGTYNAVVTVSDGRGGVDTATVRIDVGNTAPQPVIQAPTTSKLFRVGEVITLTGFATDAQDGTLPNSSLTWQVLRHHNNDRTHPYFGPTDEWEQSTFHRIAA